VLEPRSSDCCFPECQPIPGTSQMPIRRTGTIKCPFDERARCSGKIVAGRCLRVPQPVELPGAASHPSLQVPPVARSSCLAPCAHGAAPIASNPSIADRRRALDPRGRSWVRSAHAGRFRRLCPEGGGIPDIGRACGPARRRRPRVPHTSAYRRWPDDSR
jgi:hypothetical protein